MQVLRLRVIETKGARRRDVNLFQEVSSGRYPIGTGEEHLIFLHRNRPYPGSGSMRRGTFHVRYACGQSKPWREIGPLVRAQLRRWAVRTR